MKHIVQFSGGAASAFVAWLVVQKYGCDNTILLFHDTKAEHPDAYRFRQQVSKFVGVPITEASDGRDLWQVIEDNHSLPSFHIPFCTRILKQEPAEKYYQSMTADFTLYNGLGPEEPNRATRSIIRGEHAGRKVRCLLMEGRIRNDYIKKYIRDKWKICLPEPYLYLEHNNCIPCFKAGKGHFYKVWRHYPEQFERARQMEELVGHTVFKGERLEDLAELWQRSGEQAEIDFGQDNLPCMCAI